MSKKLYSGSITLLIVLFTIIMIAMVIAGIILVSELNYSYDSLKESCVMKKDVVRVCDEYDKINFTSITINRTNGHVSAEIKVIAGTCNKYRYAIENLQPDDYIGIMDNLYVPHHSVRYVQ